MRTSRGIKLIDLNQHYNQILKFAEKKAKNMMLNQVSERASFDYGGIFNLELGLANPGEAINALIILIPLYLNQDSIYYQSKLLSEVIGRLLDYIERVQRPDGTFDLVTTNFYSAPDTGFSMHNLVNAYRVITRYGQDNQLTISWQKRLYQLIKKAGYGIVQGGFHTPNHRWVITAALLMAYQVVESEDFKLMAERYLAEGIDCDQNGEYAERSSGIYNATNNDALIKIAEETGNQDLFKYIKRNLEMMFYYYEPDGSVFTQNSTRQDKGEKKTFYPTPYYHIYLYLAWKNLAQKTDNTYLNLADYIIENIEKWQGTAGQYQLANHLCLFMLKPEIREIKHKQEKAKQIRESHINYHKYFQKSGVVRSRRDHFSYTLLQNNSNFLYFQVGSLSLSLKICASFFAVAQFKTEKIEKLNDGYLMSFTTSGSYQMPFENPPETNDWWEMDHSQRQLVKRLKLKIDLYLTEIKDGLKLRIVSSGCDRVPIKLEAIVTADSLIEGNGYMLTGQSGQSIVGKSGMLSITKGEDAISIGPAFARHNFAANMRGSEPQSNHDFTIYFTEFTNLDKEILIKKGPVEEQIIRRNFDALRI